MRKHQTRTTAAAAAAALLLAACGSSSSDHAGSNVATEGEEDPAAAEEEAGEDEEELDEEAGEEDAADTEDAVPEDEASGWQVPTTPYGEAAEVETDGDATGAWIVTVDAPECGLEIELGEFSWMDEEDAEAQGQWCAVDIEATNDGDQPLDFWMDNSVAVADWQGRTFTPDSEATSEANDSLYDDTQVGQSYGISVWFDVPADLASEDLAGVAIERSWARDGEVVVWSDEDSG